MSLTPVSQPLSAFILEGLREDSTHAIAASEVTPSVNWKLCATIGWDLHLQKTVHDESKNITVSNALSDP